MCSDILPFEVYILFFFTLHCLCFSIFILICVITFFYYTFNFQTYLLSFSPSDGLFGLNIHNLLVLY